LGAPVSTLTDGRLKKVNYKQRIISGNVLTGTRVKPQNYLGYYDSQVTVIPEGDEYELLGWATPGVDKFSASKAFFSKLFPKKEYEMNANLHGGERAFVMSDQYDKVLPMDILPVFLLKSCWPTTLTKWSSWEFMKSLKKILRCANMFVLQKLRCRIFCATE
jgi:Na+-transporting NADH:ubiquinone oxidoreductase subunit A